VCLYFNDKNVIPVAAMGRTVRFHCWQMSGQLPSLILINNRQIQTSEASDLRQIFNE